MRMKRITMACSRILVGRNFPLSLTCPFRSTRVDCICYPRIGVIGVVYALVQRLPGSRHIFIAPSVKPFMYQRCETTNPIIPGKIATMYIAERRGQDH